MLICTTLTAIVLNISPCICWLFVLLLLKIVLKKEINYLKLIEKRRKRAIRM
jgi:hypothetical protein